MFTPSVVRRGPSAWGSVSGPLKPSSHAGLGLAVPNPAVTSGANFWFACRRSFVPVRTPRSVTRTLPCHLAESPDFSPPPSPAIAVSRERGARWRVLRVLSEYSLSVNGYPNHSRPSGRACCFVFGYRFGYWGTPVGPTPSPRPRRAQVWHDRAALGGAPRQSPNRPIARRIRRRRERPEPQRVRRLRLRRIGR